MSNNFNLLLINENCDNSPRSWICIKGGKIKEICANLEEEIIERRNLNRERISKRIAKSLSCNYVSIKNILRGANEFYPIPVILELCNLSKKRDYHKKKIEKSIGWLKVNSASAKPIKVPRRITKTLAKIIGAFCADGSLTINVTIAHNCEKQMKRIKKILKIHKKIKKSASRKQHYLTISLNKNNIDEIREFAKGNARYKIQTHHSTELSDEHKSNVEAFNKWIFEEFRIRPTSFKMKKNSWRTVISNKILARYFIHFFNFSPGYKANTVKEPEIIKDSSLKIRKEFAKGVLMFDGCVTKGKKIIFSTKSSHLAESIKDILNKDHLKSGFFKNKKNEYVVYTTSKNNSCKLLDYFEKGTKKWGLLKWLIHKNFESKEIDYSKEIKFAKDILNLLKKIRSADADYLAKKFNYSHTTIREKLKILDKKSLIRLSNHPKKITNYVSRRTRALLKKTFHFYLFKRIIKKFGNYKKFSVFLGISNKTLSTWKVRKNRIPLKTLKTICESLEVPFDKALKNICETDREIAEIT